MSSQSRPFRAETRKVLNILTHSLYTNREIFLRELLSNASDALEKVRFLQSRGEALRQPELPLEIRITADKDKGILTITDTGVGMTEEEMADNLGTIAKSGSENFLKDHGVEKPQKPEVQDAEDTTADAEAEETESSGSSDASQIIGHFGVGFYSVFMVADRVEVISIPAQENQDGTAHIWTSDGADSYTLDVLGGDQAAPASRGTTIRAYLKEDAKEFLETYRLQSIIRAHSQFLPFSIFVDGEQLNTTPALWREPKFSIKKEQYDEFYKFLTHDHKPPLDVIHLSVDAPVQFTALIFIPDSSQDLFHDQRDEWGLDLYTRRVLIERNNHDLVPNWLAFLKGVVDAEDLPLNISRETLQENVILRKISQTVVRQVLTHLERMAQTDKEKYARFWNLHGKYFKFSFQDFVHRDRVAPLLRFASSAMEGDAFTSLDDYLSRAKDGQKDIWHLSAPSREAAAVNPHLERFRRKGLEVLYLLEPVDEFALESLGQYKEHPFKAVEQADGKALEEFPDTDDNQDKAAPLSDDDKAAFDRLVESMKAILGDQVTEIRVSDRLSGSAACLVSPDGVSASMEKLMRVMQKSDDIPKKILEVNADHPLMRALLRIHRANPDDPVLVQSVNSLFDSILLLDGYLHDPFRMADRTLKLLNEAAGWYADLRKL